GPGRRAGTYRGALPPADRGRAAPAAGAGLMGGRSRAAALAAPRTPHCRCPQASRRHGASCMTGFSQSWLDLREAADHRSRNSRLARLLAEHFAARRPIRVLDLGCGTGSNLRATAPLLGPEQHWRLIDHDEGLLAAAASRLRGWAHASRLEEERLVLSHGAKRISVEFQRADLARDLMGMLSSDTSLVAASALMDLGSGD